MNNKYRIAICQDTGKEVLQILEKAPDTWLCLHHNNERFSQEINAILDQAAVDGFKAGAGINDKTTDYEDDGRDGIEQEEEYDEYYEP